MRTIGVVLFPGFELLDVYGPLEILGMWPDQFQLRMVAETSPATESGMGPASVVDDLFSDDKDYDALLIPGGAGTRTEVNNPIMLDWLKRKSEAAEYVTTVCTGSAILAKTGLLDGRKATTNKIAFEWVTTCGPDVDWQKQARWVEDGKYFTSSGVSAGMDMALGFIAHLMGQEAAEQTADWAEYDWHQDAGWDPFAGKVGLV
ncbi:MAG: DJ-1/PfpI family protein [Rhodospirillales bacterium]|jgi:putative intracellular protease/amidase|nr:DJ-1/PfpI family protein [Rhodospirillales bacterium]MBT4039241.1 DJ-1/PfpI family protein [Rhodospirillales bacterium]MBT4626931.1 DJ-1/PfpI family protein [Rhodospirillales bacterium]MBT5352477.1 DJ-1/PfpI family protein [Rhodospirillales bacterium]MBT5521092.1 DJ-1/PfpI family protein [Rhodospirillales bacterium]